MFDFSFLFDGLVLTNQTIFDKMPCVLVLAVGPSVVFRPCQQNLIKTSQTEANSPLISDHKNWIEKKMNIFDQSY